MAKAIHNRNEATSCTLITDFNSTAGICYIPMCLYMHKDL